MLVVGGLVVASLLVLAAVVAFSGDEAPEVLTLPAGAAPFSLAAGDEVLWVGNAGDLSVSRLRLSDGAAAGAPITLPARPGGIAVGEHVWVGSIEGAEVVRLDPEAAGGRPVPLVVGRDPAAVALEDDDVWVAALNEGSIIKLSSGGDIVEEITELEFPSALAFLRGELWAADVTEGTVSRIDTGTAEVAETIEVGSGPTALAADGTKLWVALFRQQALAALEPSGEVRVVDLGAAPSGVATGDGYVWVTLPEEDALVRVDPTSLEVSDRVAVGDNPQGIVVAGGAVWVANQGDNTVTRLALPDE
ncbi:MAG: hypothetical protein ACRDK3_02595 [Actinomycetota bacterium]